MFYLPSKNKTKVGMKRNWLHPFDNPTKEELVDGVFQFFRLTMQVVPWIMKPMHESPYLSRNWYINLVLGSMGMDALRDRVPGSRATKAMG